MAARPLAKRERYWLLVSTWCRRPHSATVIPVLVAIGGEASLCSHLCGTSRDTSPSTHHHEGADQGRRGTLIVSLAAASKIQ